MWHFTKTTVQRWADRLLHIHDTPERTAAAFALGIAIGFSPVLGLHTIIGLALAFALNLNRVALLLGIYANLPWFMPAYYGATTALGAWLTGTRMPPDFLQRLNAILALPEWGHRFDALATLLRPLLLPYMLGGTLGCLVLGAVAYPLSLTFIRVRRKRQ